MPQDDYERYRRRLEQQLHADIGMLYEAFHAKLRAYQTIVRSRAGELDLDLDPAPPPAAGGAPHPPPVPAAAPAPQAPPPQSEPESVIDAIREVLPRLPEEFDKFDILEAIAFEPRRSTFYQALGELRREGVIEVVREAGKTGRSPAKSRRSPMNRAFRPPCLYPGAHYGLIGHEESIPDAGTRLFGRKGLLQEAKISLVGLYKLILEAEKSFLDGEMLFPDFGMSFLESEMSFPESKMLIPDPEKLLPDSEQLFPHAEKLFLASGMGILES